MHHTYTQHIESWAPNPNGSEVPLGAKPIILDAAIIHKQSFAADMNSPILVTPSRRSFPDQEEEKDDGDRKSKSIKRN